MWSECSDKLLSIFNFSMTIMLEIIGAVENLGKWHQWWKGMQLRKFMYHVIFLKHLFFDIRWMQLLHILEKH